MRMKFQVLSIYLLFSFNTSIFSQNSFHNAILRIGDNIPDIELQLHYGDSIKTTHLSDFRGKMIIFDYWATTCYSCIVALPRMKQLQEKFKDKMSLIVYTNEKKDKVDALWTKMKGKFPQLILDVAKSLPFVVSDSLLQNFFGTNVYGLKVWVDANHTFKAVTYEESVNEKNIETFINGGNVNFSNYKATAKAEYRDSWLQNKIGYVDHLMSYSILSKFDEDFLGNGQFFDEQFTRDSASNKIIGLFMINSGIIDLCKMAYFHGPERDYKIVVESKNVSKFYPPLNTDTLHNWEMLNKYCYALKFNSDEQQDIFSKMKSDLKRYFNVEGSFQVRNVKCMCLKRISYSDKISSKGAPAREELISGYDTRRLIIQNQPIARLLEEIYNYYSDGFSPPVQFIDETNYTKNIDIELPWAGLGKNRTIRDLRKSLVQYGLDLVEEWKLKKVLVLNGTSN
jgi:thiol-disulfide isomerase/thioredoxin